jgi:hypothetical protein
MKWPLGAYGTLAYFARPRVPSRLEINTLLRALCDQSTGGVDLAEMPDPSELRSYASSAGVTSWAEDYPNAARWLIQFADLLDALAERET